MHLYTTIFGRQIPSYGLMIVIGVLLANLLAFINMKKSGHDLNHFIVLEAYAFLGAFLGAKLLYLVVSFQEIDWDNFFNFEYFNELMLGGFVFYGGLIGAIIAIFLAGKLHHIDAGGYINDYIYMIPLIHGFGRIGCFMAGCCYGIAYSGFGHVIFPEGSYAPSGISLFPVQLLEAVLLFIIFILLLYIRRTVRFQYMVEAYLLLYGVVRFFLEFLRNDEIRGYLWLLSTSQWLSLLLIAAALLSLFVKNKH